MTQPAESSSGSRTLSLGLGLYVLIVGSMACSSREEPGRLGAATQKLRLATTTSTRDSGLMEQLLPRFESSHQARVEVVAMGTGQALKLGEQGDVDVLLVHAREAELRFLQAGHGVRHEEIMYNFFALLGPLEDPVGIKGLDPVQGLKRLASSAASFVSRGDNSGTHQRELRLWELGGGRPDWSGYLETGQGQAATLVIADQIGAYVLADRGTYLKLRAKLSLVPLIQKGKTLYNPYAALAVDPAKHPAIQGALAQRLIDFLRAAETQKAIADFRLGDEALFHPFASPLTLPPRAADGIPR